MITHNLGYPRIGSHRELKKACEQHWDTKTNVSELHEAARSIRWQNWQLQKDAGLDIIPCNDFSFYDHVLDTACMVGAIPERFHNLIEEKPLSELDLYFAMARGYQQNGYDITAMEMTKWFDTNYHYIVPEFTRDQKFSLLFKKVIQEFHEASGQGFQAKPVLLGPISFLLLGKEKENGFHRLDLIDNLFPVYLETLQQLDEGNAHYIQIDEPCLSLNLTNRTRELYTKIYTAIQMAFPHLHIILSTYFECFGENLQTALNLPVQTLHLDLISCPSQLDDILSKSKHLMNKQLSLGVVDGRNIWKNDFTHSLAVIHKAVQALGSERIWLAPSCSLLHVPCDLDLETNDKTLPAEVRNWMAFARQKLNEVVILGDLASENPSETTLHQLTENKQMIHNRSISTSIHKQTVKERTKAYKEEDTQRKGTFLERKQRQQSDLQLPLFPSTTIGSFPQTTMVRKWRSKWKNKELSNEEYEALIKKEIGKAIEWQEELGLDVLVHGEFERNDMVEYFGERLEGFAFTKNGWVQSYGSRCVKPPVIVGDVERKIEMTVPYTLYAQSLTPKPVKGMLTGPVTILQWSFVRNDQPLSETCMQIAYAIRDEVRDLEKAGICIIQIDEPALREGFPLRKEDWNAYLNWAVKSFKIASGGAKDETQIHTHMCYSEFNDIIDSIAALDADVITIETSRSQMELLEAFAVFQYPNDIGPGIYDIHSPRIPSKQEMAELMEKAIQVIPVHQLWVNPDCGLKTRGWTETRTALQNMMDVVRELRRLHRPLQAKESGVS